MRLAERLRIEAEWVGSVMIAPRTRKRLEAIAKAIEEREEAIAEVINQADNLGIKETLSALGRYERLLKENSVAKN
jgi:hypothetical protein